MEKTSKMNTGRIVTIVVGTALVAALAFFVYKYLDEKGKNDANVLDIEGLTTEIDDLESDIKNYQLDLEKSEEVIDQNQRDIAEKEELLIEKQKKIDRLLQENRISAQQAKELKSRIETLEYYVQKYEKENEELRKEIAEKEEVIGDLSDSLTTMSYTMEKIEQDRDRLVRKDKIASILAARTFKVFRIKGSGKAVQVEDSELKAKHMNNIRVCFTINQNTSAEKGKREIYLQIRDSEEMVIKGSKGGTFKYFYGDDVAFSAKTTVDFQGKDVDVCVDYDKPSGYEFKKGEYYLEAFADGYPIGGGRFNVE